MATLRQILRLSRLEAERAEKERKQAEAAGGKKGKASQDRSQQPVSSAPASSKKQLKEKKDSSSSQSKGSGGIASQKQPNNKRKADDSTPRPTVEKKATAAAANAVKHKSSPRLKQKPPTPKNLSSNLGPRERKAGKIASVASPRKAKGAAPEGSAPVEKRGRGRPPKNSNHNLSQHNAREKHSNQKSKKGKASVNERGKKNLFASGSDGSGEPPRKRAKKESRFDGPIRTTARNKKQVNYRNNGAGDTGGVSYELVNEEKKIAKDKQQQREQTQNIQSQAEEPPRAIVKWIECTKCNKWRKVGFGIDVEALPDNWCCEMNTWDITRASCTVPEEADDKSKQQNNGTGLFSGVGSYKKIGDHELSYRQLIYTYYKQTTQTLRRSLAQRATSEFENCSAYTDADAIMNELGHAKKDKKKQNRKKNRDNVESAVVDFILPIKLARKKYSVY